jgi:trans-2,3-dihydro-3-hydroxyanthranilate isomerase
MSEFLDYRVVDVFTGRAYAGNPLAVVLGGDDLSTEQMQAITREFNLSETTFPMPATTDQAAYKLRIFNPAYEMPFAGHPSIGTAWVMKQLGTVSDGAIRQECGAGLLPVVIDGDRATLTGGTPLLGGPIDAQALLTGVGLAAADLGIGEPRWAGTGVDFAYLPVRPEAISRCNPTGGLQAIIDASPAPNPTGAFVFSYGDGAVNARMFAAGAGVPEDPATGSAALGLGVWLAAAGLVAPDGETPYVIDQGVDMGRPSRLECVVRTEGGSAVECRVTGTTVPVAEGRIRVPVG